MWWKTALKWVGVAIPAAIGAIISQAFLEHTARDDMRDLLGIEEDDEDDDDDDE